MKSEQLSREKMTQKNRSSERLAMLFSDYCFSSPGAAAEESPADRVSIVVRSSY